MPNSTPWPVVEALLDELLSLGAVEREHALTRFAADHDAETLLRVRTWMAGIEESAGFMEPPEPPAAIDAGLTVGAWRVTEPIGRGGMGEVWLAERADGAFAMRVAIKFIRGDSTRLRERFALERRILAQLEHPHIARLIDAGIDAQGRPYLVTEFVDGTALDAWTRRSPDLAARLDVFRQICHGVAHAHANLIVHRDLKPGNVLVDGRGQAKLLDFGIAKLIGGDIGFETIEHPLTPDCAAPEQISGGVVTTRTDVYALGVLLYRLLTGRSPLPAGPLPLAELVRRICHEMPPAPSAMPDDAAGVPITARTADFDAIVLKALAKEPGDRYPTVDALLVDLDNVLAMRPVTARIPTAGYRARRFLRRNRVAVAAASAVIVALACGLGGTLWQARVAARERDSALYLAERSDAARDFLVRLLGERGGTTALDPGELTTRAAALLENEPSMRPDVRAMMRETVGELQLERRDFGKAEALFQRVVDDAGDAAHDEMAIDAMCQLGAVKSVMGKKDEASRWLGLGLDRARSLDGSERVTLARCLSYAATANFDQGNMDAAIALARESVDEIDRFGGRYVSRQSALHNNYANLLAGAGRSRSAQTEYRRALDLLAQAGRSRSADASTAAGNLARSIDEAGLPLEAVARFEQAIALRHEVSGDSIGLAQQLSTQAGVLVELGRGQEALIAIDRAAAMLVALGDSSATRQAQLHLRRASAYAELGRRDDAEREYEKSERLDLQMEPPPAVALASIALGRASLWMRTGTQPDDLVRVAKELDNANAREHRRVPGASSLPEKLERAAAELALLRRDAEGAVAHARAARELDVDALDPRAWQIAACDALLGEAAMQQKRTRDAVALLESSVAGLTIALGPDHWRVRQAREWLAASRGAGS